MTSTMTPAVVFSGECAAMLGIDRRTLRRWVKSGGCPLPRVTIGRRQAFVRADVAAYLAHNFGAGRRKVNR